MDSILEKKINKFCEKHTFKIRWGLKNLSTRKSIGSGINDVISVGSVRKVFILLSAMSEIQDKNISLDEKFLIDKKFKENRSGILRYIDSDFELSFEELLLLMIIVSDNTATGIIVDKVDLEDINNYIDKVGFRKTQIMSGFPPVGREHLPEYSDVSTIKEINDLFFKILKGGQNEKDAQELQCSKDLCKLALEILKKQTHKTRLPYLLSDKEVVVAHKTGTRTKQGVFGDSGIIFYKKEPLLILSVFTERTPDYIPNRNEASLTIAEISKMCFEYLI